jgi:putative ABC transport system substrate-binding protein
LAAIGSVAAAWTFPARSQQLDRMRRIGVLMAYAATDREAVSRVDAFIKELRQLGWEEGRNVQFDYRWAGGDPARIATQAADLVKTQPDVILAATTPVVRALLANTRTTPIVFLSVSDPVGDRFVESLAQPGGNATGFINIESSMAGKWVELLKEIAPRTARLSIVFNPKTAAGAGSYFIGPFETAARSSGLEPVVNPVHDAADFERVIASLAASPGGALIVMPDSFNVVHRGRIIALAARFGVPTVYPYRYMAAAGGLMSYGVDLVDMYKRAAPHVDAILRGKQPREFPIQAPVKFELVINTRTAKDLKLQVPPLLLARADEVLE